VFQVTGPGGDHFFYHSRRKDTRVVWLTVDAVDVRTVLLATIDNF
jgi:hypothetical protein